jgi:hypothetical protein
MKPLSTKNFIAIGSSVVLALLAAQVLSAAIPRPAPDRARQQQVAQYCVPHEDSEIGAQGIFC